MRGFSFATVVAPPRLLPPSSYPSRPGWHPAPVDGVEDADGGLTGVVPRGDVLLFDPWDIGNRDDRPTVTVAGEDG